LKKDGKTVLKML